MPLQCVPARKIWDLPVVQRGVDDRLVVQRIRTREDRGIQLLEVNVVIDCSQGRLVSIEIAELGADGLTIDQIAIKLLDRKQRRVQESEHFAEIDTCSVERPAGSKGRVEAAPVRRPCQYVPAQIGILLPAQDGPIEASYDAAGIAGLAPNPGRQIVIFESVVRLGRRHSDICRYSRQTDAPASPQP